MLTVASPFFSKLLQSDMKENREGIVRFEEISGAVMEDVLEFIYTGSVEVTQENSKDLIAAANYLLIPGLKKHSGNERWPNQIAFQHFILLRCTNATK